MSKLFSYDGVVKCRRNLNFRKKWWSLTTERHILGVTQTKYYYGSAKKSKSSFSCHLQIDKKINIVNKNRFKSKTWFKLCLWGFSKKESYVVYIYFYTTRLSMKFYSQRHISAKGVSQIYPPVSGANFSNDISIPRVRVNIEKTEHDTTFEIS